MGNGKRRRVDKDIDTPKKRKLSHSADLNSRYSRSPSPSRSVSPTHSIRSDDERDDMIEEDNGVIRCICGFTEDDGFTIQCEKCFVWQHGICVGIESTQEAPEHYYCEQCEPRWFDVKKAKEIQKKVFAKKMKVEAASPAVQSTKRPRRASYTGEGSKSQRGGYSGGRGRRKKPNSNAKGRRKVDNEEIPEADATDNDSDESTVTDDSENEEMRRNLDANSLSSNWIERVQPDFQLFKHIQFDSISHAHVSEPCKDIVQRMYRQTGRLLSGIADDLDKDVEAESLRDLIDASSIITMSLNSFDGSHLLLTKPANDRTCYFLVFPGSIVQDPPSLPSAEIAETLPSSVPDSTPSSPSPKFASLFTYATPVEKAERPGIFTSKTIGPGEFITELMGRVVVKPDICSQYFGSSADSTAPSFAPFVFSHHSIPLLIDSRQYGNTSRFVRRGCEGNTRVTTVYASSEQDFKLGVFAEKEIPEESEILISYNATDIDDLSKIDYESMMEGCSDTSNHDTNIKPSCIMFECASCLLVNYERCRLFQTLSTNPHVKVVPVTSQLPPTPPESTVRRTKVKRRKDSTTEKKKKKSIAEGSETVRRKPGPKPKGRTKPGPKPGRGRRSRVSSPRPSEDPATQYFDYEGDSDVEMENGDPNATDSDQRDEEDKERQDVDPNSGNHERKKRRDRSWSQQPAMSREERKIQEQLALMARMENSGERGSRRKPGPKPKSHNLNRKATSEPSSPTSRNLTNYNSENEDASDSGKVYYSSPNQSDEDDSRLKSSEDSLSSSSSESATDDSEHELHLNSNKNIPNIQQSGSQRTKSILSSRTIISTKTCVIRTCPLKVVFGPPQHYYMNGVTVFGGGKKLWKRLYEEDKLRNLMEVDDVSQSSQNPSLPEKNGFISSPDDDETKIDVEKLEVETPSGSDEIDPVTISKETSPIDTVPTNSEDVKMDDVVNVVDDAEEISVDDVQKEPIIDVVHDDNDGKTGDVNMDDSSILTERKEETVDVVSVEPSINVSDPKQQQVSAASPDVTKPVDSVEPIEVLPHSDSKQQDTLSADTKPDSTQLVPPPKPKTKLSLKDYKRKMATRSDSRPELDDPTGSLPVITPVDTPSSFCVERDAETDQVVPSVSSTVEKTDESVASFLSPPEASLEKSEVEVKREFVESVQTQPETTSLSSSTMELFPVNNDSQFELFPVDTSTTTMDLFAVRESPELKTEQTKLKFSLNSSRSEMSKVEPKKRSPLAEKEPSETEQNEPLSERRKSLSSSRSSSPKYTTTTPPLPSTAPPSSQTHYPPSTYNSYPQPPSYSKYNSYRPHHSHSVRSFPSRYGQYSYRPDYSSSQGPPSTSSSSQYEPPIPSSTDTKPSSSYYNSRYSSGSSRSDTYASSSSSRGGYYSSERDRGYYRDRDRSYEYRDERDRYGSSRDSRDSDYYRDERDERDPRERRRDDYDSSVSVPSGASLNSNPSTQSSASRYPPPSSSGATGSGGFGGSSYNDDYRRRR